MIMVQEDGYLWIIVSVSLRECSEGKIMLHKKNQTHLFQKADNQNYLEVEENMSGNYFAVYLPLKAYVALKTILWWILWALD